MVECWERFLKVSGWHSEYLPVDNLFRYLRLRCGGAESSRRAYGYWLYSFCKLIGVLPDRLVVLSKKKIESLLEQFGYSLRERGAGAGSVNVALSDLKTFFLLNGFKGKKEVEFEFCHRSSCVRVREEYVPTLEEALRMAEYAKTLRDKTMILFMAYSGLRNNTLLAIKFGDIREELEHGVEPLLIKVYPEMKKLVSSAAKGNVGYFTFVPKNVVEVLKLYVAQKRERMGAILDDYPLFSSEHNQLLKKDRFGKPLSARQLEVIVKRAAKDAGIIKWKFVHPHCLRKTCDSFLRSQLCDGGRLDIQTQIYFMGHTLPGGLKPYFDARVEDMRKEYSKLVPLPNEAKLNKVTEALKALADALRISRTQSPLGVRDEVSANQGKKAYDAFQAFLEEFGLVNVGENHS